MWYTISKDELYHSGVKGMKWGVVHEKKKDTLGVLKDKAQDTVKEANKKFIDDVVDYMVYDINHDPQTLLHLSKDYNMKAYIERLREDSPKMAKLFESRILPKLKIKEEAELKRRMADVDYKKRAGSIRLEAAYKEYGMFKNTIYSPRMRNLYKAVESRMD